MIFPGVLFVLATLQVASSHGDQPLSGIAIHKATFAFNVNAYVNASPTILGSSVCFTSNTNSLICLFYYRFYHACMLQEN